MAKNLVDSYSKFTLKINNAFNGSSFGFSEVYYAGASTDISQVRAKGKLLAEARACMLPDSARIEECGFALVPNERKALPCLDSPIPGKYGKPYVVIDASANKVKVVAGVGGTGTLADIDMNDGLQINASNDAANFYFLSDDFIHNVHQFGGIPDLMIADFAAKAKEDGFVWMDQNPLPNPLPDIEVNVDYWKNWKQFFLILRAQFFVVNKNPEAKTDNAAKKFVTAPFYTAIFKKIGQRDRGRPIGGSRGREPIR